MRLACVKHAASVRSEPGSNSQVHPNTLPQQSAKTNKPIQPKPSDLLTTYSISRTRQRTKQINQSAHREPITNPYHHPTPSSRMKESNGQAPPTYPFHTDAIVKERRQELITVWRLPLRRPEPALKSVRTGGAESSASFGGALSMTHASPGQPKSCNPKTVFHAGLTPGLKFAVSIAGRTGKTATRGGL